MMEELKKLSEKERAELFELIERKSVSLHDEYESLEKLGRAFAYLKWALLLITGLVSIMGGNHPLIYLGLAIVSAVISWYYLRKSDETHRHSHMLQVLHKQLTTINEGDTPEQSEEE